jgi:hypothetical protein
LRSGHESVLCRPPAGGAGVGSAFTR